MNNTTIAGIATGSYNNGISIIRVSGEDSLSIVDRIFTSNSGKHFLKNVNSHTINYGFIINPENNEKIDEVLVSVMKAPRSFTSEDVVEINCHGGFFVTKKILDIVCKNGARLAEPGEFTKRAFLNGRIDLSEAEAVMDIISSNNQISLKASMNQLTGGFSDKISNLRNEILEKVAFIEAALDDPEHYDLSDFSDSLLESVELWMNLLNKLIASGNNGIIARDGIRTVIVGKPNVGKSSLLNMILGENRAIVTDISGTTRDTLEESVRLGDLTLNLIDTAGIHHSDDVVEKIGIDKAIDAISQAALVLFIIDSSSKLSEDDYKLVSLLENKKVIVLLNKSDLDSVLTKDDIDSLLNPLCLVGNNPDVINISAKAETGIENIENCIKKMFFSNTNLYEDEIISGNARHLECLINANNSLGLVKESISNCMEEDFYSIDLMNAYTELGKILGIEVEDDLVEMIFSKFCMGK